MKEKYRLPNGHTNKKDFGLRMLVMKRLKYKWSIHDKLHGNLRLTFS